MLALRLPEEIESRLDALAKATGRTKSFYAKEAILAHLEDLEDIYLAEAAVERFRASGEKTVSLKEMERRLAVEG
jgi:RHH-type rel operon transcriptional repressor/antitoxin RelB